MCVIKCEVLVFDLAYHKHNPYNNEFMGLSLWLIQSTITTALTFVYALLSRGGYRTPQIVDSHQEGGRTGNRHDYQ